MTKRAWMLAVLLAALTTGCESKPQSKPSIPEGGAAQPGAMKTSKIATH